MYCFNMPTVPCSQKLKVEGLDELVLQRLWFQVNQGVLKKVCFHSYRENVYIGIEKLRTFSKYLPMLTGQRQLGSVSVPLFSTETKSSQVKIIFLERFRNKSVQSASHDTNTVTSYVGNSKQAKISHSVKFHHQNYQE